MSRVCNELGNRWTNGDYLCERVVDGVGDEGINIGGEIGSGGSCQ